MIIHRRTFKKRHRAGRITGIGFAYDVQIDTWYLLGIIPLYSRETSFNLRPV